MNQKNKNTKTKPKIKYCGTSLQVPEHYQTRGHPYECLRKGYGICFYSNKEGTKVSRNATSISAKEKIYCGTQQPLPPTYDRKGHPYECLRKGYGVCLYNPRRRKVKKD